MTKFHCSDLKMNSDNLAPVPSKSNFGIVALQPSATRRSIALDRGVFLPADMPEQKPTIAQESAEIANRRETCSNQFLKRYIVVMLIFEKYVIVVLALLLAIFILTSLIECGYALYHSFSTPPNLIFGTSQYGNLFSSFFYVLIGIELMQSVAVHIETSDAHVEIIILVAITAVARKIIILDSDKATFEKMAGISLVTGILGLTFFLVKMGKRSVQPVLIAADEEGEEVKPIK